MKYSKSYIEMRIRKLETNPVEIVANREILAGTKVFFRSFGKVFTYTLNMYTKINAIT